MAIFRIRDLIVAITSTPGTGCVAQTHALFACVKGKSVVPDCAYSDYARHVPPLPRQLCPVPSIIPTCQFSDYRVITDPIRPPGALAEELAQIKAQLAELTERMRRGDERGPHECRAREPESLQEIDQLLGELRQAVQALEKQRDRKSGKDSAPD